MKLDPLLSKAARFAKKKEYEKAMKILRDEEDRYYGSFKYYYLCGVISLYSGAFLDAKHYFESAKKIKINDPFNNLGLACLYVRGMGSRGANISQAVNYYLDVLDLDPNNKIAKKALAVIKENAMHESVSDWLTVDLLIKLFPPIPNPGFSFQQYVIMGTSFFIALIILIGILISQKVLPNPFINKNARPITEFVLNTELRSAPVETGGSYSYILSRSEAVSLYERSLNLFSNYRDERAKVNLNKILNSNASEGLKNRARLLLQNTEVPGFDNFKRSDNYSFAEIMAEPILYRGVHVIWRGMATNVEITDEYTRFDFLVGYDTRRSLEGIIPVIFNVPVSINTERPLEVLGRVAFTREMEIVLEGVAIHQSGRLEN